MHVRIHRLSRAISQLCGIFCLWVCSVTSGYCLDLEVLETVWREGDNTEWAVAHVDQSEWQHVNEFRGAPKEVFWIREVIVFSEAGGVDNFALAFEGTGAFEVFFDGVHLGGSGHIGEDVTTEQPGSTQFFVGIPNSMVSEGRHVLALRVSASQLSSAKNFFVEYQLRKADVVIGEIGLSMIALGAAAASALILIYFFAAGSSSNKIRREFLAAIIVALGVIFIVVVEALSQVGRIPYTGRSLADMIAMIGAISAFGALPTYLVLHFRLTSPWVWLLGAFAVFSISILPWPGSNFEHDARAFILLSTYGLVICVLAYKIHGRRVLPFFLTFALLLLSIMVAPESLYIFLVCLSVFLSVSFADFTRQQQLAVKQAEVTAARLEAEMLRRNIQPHFLMNSLTAITEWIETAPMEALRFVDGLAEEFRSLSKLSAKTLVPLPDEIALCQVHLELMGMRQRRKYSLQCKGLDMAEMVPPGIFHTLLENALSHNRYCAAEIKFDLEFSKTSDGKTYVLKTPLGQSTNHSEKSTGAGLLYIKSRLEESFPGQWHFSSKSTGSDWVSRISIRSEKGAARVEDTFG